MSCISNNNVNSSTSTFLFNPCSPCCCVGGDQTFVLFATDGCPNINNYAFSGYYAACTTSGSSGLTTAAFSGNVKLLNDVSLQIFQGSGIVCNLTTSCSGTAVCPSMACGNYTYLATCACYQPCSGSFTVANGPQKIHLKLIQSSGSDWSYTGPDQQGEWQVINPYKIRALVSGYCAGLPEAPICAGDFVGTATKTFCNYCDGYVSVQIDYRIGQGSYVDGGIITNSPSCGSSPNFTPTSLTPNPTNTSSVCFTIFSETFSGFFKRGLITATFTPTIHTSCSGETYYDYTIINNQTSSLEDMACDKCSGCFDGVGNLVGTDPAGSFTLHKYGVTSWSGCHVVNSPNTILKCKSESESDIPYIASDILGSGTAPIFYNVYCYNDYYLRVDATYPICLSGFYPQSGTCVTSFNHMSPTLFSVQDIESIICDPLDIDLSIRNTNEAIDYIPYIFSGYSCSFPLTITT